ncbi:transglycosylase family protein [Streptomyces sp. NPDC093225]|uniref:transglycosylase family protein n=1 Tax=Streptomyces sp. NPDC093225 TaxID=3366034 RepID=UPI0038134CCD
MRTITSTAARASRPLALAFAAACLAGLAAQPAQAASVATWDKVAECEAGGNWSINTGNGYYGGLQFSLSTWKAFGGAQYAAYPHQATKQQQILIGEKVLAGQGQGAWPTCGARAGLGADHADPYPAVNTAPSTAGVYRSEGSMFYVSDANGGLAGYAGFGAAGDVPLTGDWNGDGKDTFGVYRPSDQTFYLTNDNGTVAVARKLGNPDDVPVVGDWDGNGSDTIGVYRPGDQTFYLTNDNANVATARRMGVAGDAPMTGDWNGDGVDTVGVYRPADTTFYLSDSNATASVSHTVKFGNPGDVPIKGDWNGDGTDKVGVYRPAESDFFGAAKDSNTVIYNKRFGNPGDTPITGSW